MLKLLLAGAGAMALLALPAAANDGFSGITATGLQFENTDAVAMTSEDLFVGLDEIRVAYVFRNDTAADVAGTVTFPMPAINVSAMQFENFRLPSSQLDGENPLGFTVTVNGKAVAFKTDRRAYFLKPDEIDPNATEAPPAPPESAAYDAPGEDITDELTALGIPITFDTAAINAAIDKLPDPKKKELEARGLAGFNPDDADSKDMRYVIGWSIGIRHFWPQVFPANAEVRISHRYQSAPSGGLFYWYDWTKPDEMFNSDPMADYKRDYCVDAGTGDAIRKALPQSPESPGSWNGTAYNIDYILTTANTWKGPIGNFRLTLDKGNAKNVLSLCADGVKKAGPTSFVVEKTNYTPKTDLKVLIITPP